MNLKADPGLLWWAPESPEGPADSAAKQQAVPAWLPLLFDLGCWEVEDGTCDLRLATMTEGISGSHSLFEGELPDSRSGLQQTKRSENDPF